MHHDETKLTQEEQQAKELLKLVPIVLPFAGAVLIFLLAFIAVYMT